MKITDVNPEDVDAVLPLVEDYINKAIAKGHGEYTAEDIIEGLHDGVMRLWIAYEDGEVEAAAVTTLVRYPSKTIAWVLFMAGENMRLWQDANRAVEEWARENGASEVMAYARKGVAKVFEIDGYESIYTVIKKDLIERSVH